MTVALLDTLNQTFQTTKKLYDQGHSPLRLIGSIAERALALLASEATVYRQASGDAKQYDVYCAAKERSRPIFPGLFITNLADFRRDWSQMVAGITPEANRITLAQRELAGSFMQDSDQVCRGRRGRACGRS